METTVTELTAQLTDSKEKASQLDAQVTRVAGKGAARPPAFPTLIQSFNIPTSAAPQNDC